MQSNTYLLTYPFSLTYKHAAAANAGVDSSPRADCPDIPDRGNRRRFFEWCCDDYGAARGLQVVSVLIYDVPLGLQHGRIRQKCLPAPPVRPASSGPAPAINEGVDRAALAYRRSPR